MKKTLIAIACTCIVSLGLYGCGQKDETATTQEQAPVASSMEKENPELTNLEGVNYTYKDLSDEAVNYLKTKSQYKELYKNKKFVVYNLTPDCACAKALMDTIDPLKANPEIAQNYNFYPEKNPGKPEYDSEEDQKASREFASKCQQFCIVNPNTNEVFTINDINNKDVAKLGSVFEQLKNW